MTKEPFVSFITHRFDKPKRDQIRKELEFIHAFHESENSVHDKIEIHEQNVYLRGTFSKEELLYLEKLL